MEGNLQSRGDYATEWAHHQWNYLVVATKHYIVYVDEECDVDWETSPAYDDIERENKSHNIRAKNDILNTGALLEVTPCDGLQLSTRKHFKRLIGEAYAKCFDFDYEGAKAMLQAARSFITARSEEVSRNWYLSASGWIALPFFLAGVTLWMVRNAAILIIGGSAFWVMMAAIAGGMGALLSVITRAGRLQIDCAAGKKLHKLEAGSRIIAGVISGSLASLAIKSGVLLSVLIKNGDAHPIIMLTGLSAGYAERLAPSIIAKFHVRDQEKHLESA